MKLPLVSTTFFVAFTVVWLGWSYVDYEMLAGGDCSYMDTEECRARLRFEPWIIFWRAAAVQLLATHIYLFVRNR